MTELQKDWEIRYRRLFETAQDGILILNGSSGEIEDANPYLLKLLGYSHAELITKKLWKVDAFKTIIASHDAFLPLQSNESIRYEDLSLTTKDGRLLQVEFISNRYLVGKRKVIQCNIRDITERQQIEAMLRVSEEHYHSLIEQAGDGIFVIDGNGKYIDVNTSGCAMLGYTRAEILEKSFADLIPTEDREKIPPRLAELRSGRTLISERRLICKDGSLLPVEISSKILADGRMYGIVRDITERKHAKEIGTKLGAIVESSDDAIIGKTLEGVITSWNHGAEQLYGYSADEVIGQSISILIPPNRPDELPEILAKIKGGETVKHFETERVRKDGADVDVSLSISPIKDVAGQVIGASTIARDITQRKQAEKALKDSQQLFYEIFHASPTAIVLSRLSDGRFVEANQNFLNLTGYSLEEVIGLTSVEAGIIVDSKVREERLNALQQNKPLPNFEVEITRKSGEHRIGLTSVGIVSLNGEQFALSNFVDITEHRQAEDALRINEERLKLALAATRTGVWEWNAQTDQVFWSPECYEIMGMDFSTEPTLASFLKFIHPEDLERVNEGIQRSLTQQEKFSIEFRVITPRGEMLWLQDIGKAEYDANGSPIRMLGIVRDITARKKSEELLHENDNRLRALLENSADAITLIDARGTIIYDSPAAPGLLGYTPEDWIGQDVFKLVHPEDLLEVQSLFEKLVQKEDTRLSSTFRIRHKNGFWFWIEIVATNALAQPGVNAIILNYRDITKRKQADERLRSAREFLQSVQDALSTHIAILDQQGTIVHVNAAWCDFGLQNGLASPDFCVGMNYLEICDRASGDFAEEARLVANAIRGALRGEKQEEQVEYPCHAPKEVRWFTVRITSFENNGQKWVVVSHANITERKQAEEKTQQQLEHLTALSAIDRAIASNFDLKLNLSEILAHVTNELGVDAADIFILNAYALEFGAERGFRSKAVKRAQLRLSDSYTGRAVIGRKMVSIPNLHAPTVSFSPEAHWADEDFACYYAVPLLAKGEVKGVLEVFHRTVLNPNSEWFDFLYMLAGQTAIAIENATLFSSLQRSNAELAMAYDATIEGWSRALDLRDKETEGHSLRVTEMTLKLARALGLRDHALAQIRWGALLHDIGKMGVPDGILLKPGPLTDDEWVIMKKHPTFAYEMLCPIHYLQQALDIPYCHHEKWDGSGYPRGLKGLQIPLSARIFAVVDVWDALKSDRPYRAGWTDEKVREHIRASSGAHFDPQVVEAFLKILK